MKFKTLFWIILILLIMGILVYVFFGHDLGVQTSIPGGTTSQLGGGGKL